jgi:drug/metabolite transporter (DMT)-like permease
MSVFAIVLFAAALHATWNAIVKAGGDKLLTTMLVTASASLLAAATLPWLHQPDPASWPFIAASALLQVLYFILVARTYEVADMSQTYPLMRGSAPLLVAIIGAGFGASLSANMWVGVGIICMGILSMAVRTRAADSRGIKLALLNAAVIAGYTLIDGIGVRRSGAPAAYTLCIIGISA